MLSLKYRSLEKELLDNGQIPFEDIKQNLIELNTINTYLGGHQITLDGVKYFLKNVNDNIHIVEIGCGGGDNLHVIEYFLKKQHLPFKLTGIDIKKECIDYAKQKYPSIEFICSDYKDVSFDIKPNIIFNSLFCHHFTNQELVQIIQWMSIHSSQGFFINDLQRHYLAYCSIKFLTFVFSKSYLVKNDAPLSVARSFRKKDWDEVFKSANMPDYSIKWKWAFRYLICRPN